MPKERCGQSWNAETYATTARFVSTYGVELLDLLCPRPGERVLDLGCGDGALTEKIGATGAEVVGVDGSETMVAAARARGLDARLLSAYELPFQEQFDAVFSNAALHWMLDPEAAVRKVRRALKPGGRFVAEFGGAANVQTIVEALTDVLEAHGQQYGEISPWYFPTSDEYSQVLEQNDFWIDSIALIPRPTPIETDIRDWLENFAASMLDSIPGRERDSAIDAIRERLKPNLCDGEGRWTIDYVRLRVKAHKLPLGE